MLKICGLERPRFDFCNILPRKSVPGYGFSMDKQEELAVAAIFPDFAMDRNPWARQPAFGFRPCFRLRPVDQFPLSTPTLSTIQHHSYSMQATRLQFDLVAESSGGTKTLGIPASWKMISMDAGANRGTAVTATAGAAGAATASARPAMPRPTVCLPRETGSWERGRRYSCTGGDPGAWLLSTARRNRAPLLPRHPSLSVRA